MYFVAISKYDTQYIVCKSKQVARSIAQDAIALGAGENNVRVYDAGKEQLQLVYACSVK